MVHYTSVVILLTLAVLCAAKPKAYTKCLLENFYIGETVETTPIVCHDDRTIVARYFHLCNIKFHFIDCPVSQKCLRKHGITTRLDEELKNNENIQDRDEALTFLDTYDKRASAKTEFNKLKGKCCKSKKSKSTCTDDDVKKTCPGGTKYSAKAFQHITKVACEMTIEEAINEG
ncbi:hypothetical protein TrispH2_010963 [Trichoplax sp. H2]|nr:hypothetical protein TrispH2_010963 [Trichoplax sp. H2]|eukprot:RDD37623.1 hypothetical protein TrispH2_010963 [Trichoplax sp. H2]